MVHFHLTECNHRIKLSSSLKALSKKFILISWYYSHFICFFFLPPKEVDLLPSIAWYDKPIKKLVLLKYSRNYYQRQPKFVKVPNKFCRYVGYFFFQLLRVKKSFEKSKRFFSSSQSPSHKIWVQNFTFLKIHCLLVILANLREISQSVPVKFLLRFSLKLNNCYVTVTIQKELNAMD